MKKKFLSALIVALIIFPGTITKASVQKDETVYASLNSDGSVEKVKVVNHIYGYENKPYYTDYGKYLEVKNLTSLDLPQTVDGEVRWDMSLLKEKDLYYEGSIDKELPVNIQIKYFLDGQGVKAEELGGKSGHLKMEFKVAFDSLETGADPNLMAQIQVSANLNVFKNIESKGTKVVTGKTAAISFVALPPQDQSFVLEMDGTNIELDPISIALIPASFSIPEDIKENMNKLTDGLGELQTHSEELGDGAAKLSSGLNQLKNGLQGLYSGILSLGKASQQVSKGSTQVSKGMDEFYKGMLQVTEQSRALSNGVTGLSQGLDQLSETSGSLNTGIGGLYNGITAVNGGVQGVNTGMDSLKAEHEKLVALAKSLETSSDPTVQEMIVRVKEEAKALEALSTGLQQSSSGLKDIETNTKNLKDGYIQFNDGLSSAAKNTKTMASQVAKFPEGLKLLTDNFAKLKTGAHDIFRGFGEISKALATMSADTKVLPTSTAELAKGQLQLEDGIKKFSNEGLGTMKTSLEENLKGSILGSSDENSYTSFVDNEKNKNSTVQFVLRTPAIKAPEVKKTETIEVKEEKGFIQKFLDLFR